MSREPWNGSPVKAGNWGTWAQIRTFSTKPLYPKRLSKKEYKALLKRISEETGRTKPKDVDSKQDHSTKKGFIYSAEWVLPRNNWDYNRRKTHCKYYNQTLGWCVKSAHNCIGSCICSMYEAIQKDIINVNHANNSCIQTSDDTSRKIQSKKTQLQSTIKSQEKEVQPMSSILPIKRTMQEQFEAETKEIILAYRSIQKSYQAMIDQIQLKVSNCMKLMDFAGAQRILADFEPFAQKIKKELENIESILNDFE